MSSAFPIQLRLLSAAPKMRSSSPAMVRSSANSSPSTSSSSHLAPWTLSSPGSSSFVLPTPPYSPLCVDEIPSEPSLINSSMELHVAIKSSRTCLIFVYSRQALKFSSKITHAHNSFLALAAREIFENAESRSPSSKKTSPRSNPSKEETSFCLICVEDVKRDDIPLIFGRLGILPSKVMSVGAAVSVQHGGRLWKVVSGKGVDAETLLMEVRKQQ